jgi:DNA polymerase I
MKSRFYLLDDNEVEFQGKPCVRFWGIDEKGKRICVLSNQIMPYFYFLPREQGNLESIKQRLLADTEQFPKILNASIETRRLFGQNRKVLKVTCAESEVRSAYLKALLKLIGQGEGYENDLRLSARYIIDLMLTPCGWNQCEVNKMELDEPYAIYMAMEAPHSLVYNSLPKLRILGYQTLTAGEKGSARPERDPIRAVAVATNSGKSTIFASDGKADGDILKGFVAFVSSFDPDVIVGFGTNTQDWPYIIQRSKKLKMKLTVGRDSSEPHTSVYGHISVTGRANFDLSDVAGGIPEVKVKTLENVSKYLQLASAGKFTTIEEWDRYGLWTQEEERKKLLQNTRMMAQASLELAEATLHFPLQLSALTGLPLDQVMAAAVGFRVDSYLIREANRIGELIPPRSEQPYFPYRGAIVLEPKTGLHEDVAVLDFASMYPKLMEKYNLSPETLVKPGEQLPEESVFVIPDVQYRFRKEPDGFYRTVLAHLIRKRSEIKTKLEAKSSGPTQRKVLKERERALKVITNACYGYAGWAGARWYAREVAESAAALGRETISKTITKAELLGLTIIYGDTDSIFVKNERAKIGQLLHWVEKELGLVIRVEREYRRILFTEAMKRYAGLLSDGSLDIVGLEVVRGDWSEIARQVQEEVLKRILQDESPQKAVEAVRAIIRKLGKGEIPLTDLTIRKTLTKPIESYAVRAPHVEVARKLLNDGWTLTIGDKVAYIIVRGSGKLFQKAKPYNQVKPEDVDREYYLENQIKPAAMRILERFGVNADQLEVRALEDQQLPGGSLS